jgi:hypothetical protein
MKRFLLLILTLFSLSFAAGARYLIITADVFSPVIQPLAQWKQKKGVATKVVKLSDIGATADSIARIKNYIVNAYNTWSPRPEFVLLVGGPTYIKADNSQYDDYYGNMTGDYKMEIAVGRFPCASLSQCSLHVSKTLGYERTPYLTDTLWFRKGTGIILQDYSTYPPNGQPDTVYWNDQHFAWGLWSGAGFVKIDSFVEVSPFNNTATDIINAMDNGRVFLFFRGQSTTNWWSPFTLDPTLTNNGFKLPVVVSATCATMTLSSSNYLGDRLLNAGTAQNPKGSVGFFGTTVVASAVGLARNRGAVGQGFYRALFSEKINTLGEAAKRAKNFADSIATPYWNSTRYREWNLLGDPELNLWTSTPRTLTVTHDTIIYSGGQTYNVTVKIGTAPLYGAAVCAMMDTIIYETKYTNASGVATFSIAPPAPETMSITVTAKNCAPYEKNVVVIVGGMTHDVGVLSIIEPVSNVAAGNVVYPKVLIKNFGTARDTFPVTFKIGSVYTQTISPVILAAGDTVTKSFPGWTAVMGSYSTKAYTALTSDQWRGNDTAAGSFSVVAAHDVGVTAILAPKDTVANNITITPKAIIKNFGINAETFSAIFKIGTGYTQMVSSINLNAGVTDTVDFLSWTTSVGTYSTQCYTQLSTDNNRSNDTANGSVYVSNSYQENFESSNGNYTASPSSSAWEWGVPTSGPGSAHSSTKLWATILADNYTNNADWKLTSVELVATQNNPTLKFWHWFNMEMTSTIYDGGNVKISTNGGSTWTVVTPVGGYTGTCISTTPGVGGQQVFSGINETWSEVVFNLPVNAGQTFLLRWHFGSDQGVVRSGWYLDDVNCIGAVPYIRNDVGIDAIIYPVGAHQANTSLEPIVRVKNYGQVTQTNFQVICSIVGVAGAYRYSNTQVVASLAASDTIHINFLTWTPTIIESCNVKMRTVLIGDQNSVNDRSVGAFVVADLTPPATPNLLSPANGAVINNSSPVFIWRSAAEAVCYNIVIKSGTQEIINEVVSDTTYIPSELVDGVYSWRVRAKNAAENWGNFSVERVFTINTTPPTPSGWLRKNSIPTLVAGKAVKDGGALVAVRDSLYAFRGNKSKEFYLYNGLSWIRKESIPFGKKPNDIYAFNKKTVAKGGALCFDGSSSIYATKGNGTKEFWKYNIANNTWLAKAFVNVPKGLKGGTSIVFYNGKVYLLAGDQRYGESNFFVYDTTANTWSPLLSAPMVDYKPFKDGSCLTLLNGKIYALKGSGKHNYFAEYNIATNTWTNKETIPLLHPRIWKKNTVKSGGAIANDGNKIYAIKGGGKNEFWQYTPGTPGIWTAIDTIPRLNSKSVPKIGAAIAYMDGKVFLLKGNNTDEFWQYTLASDVVTVTPSTYQSVMTENTTSVLKPILEITPNPIKDNYSLRFNVPISGKVMISLYNGTGQLIETMLDDYLTAGSYSIKMRPETGEIPNGIYFLRYKDINNKIEIKLIKL